MKILNGFANGAFLVLLAGLVTKLFFGISGVEYDSELLHELISIFALATVLLNSTILMIRRSK